MSDPQNDPLGAIIIAAATAAGPISSHTDASAWQSDFTQAATAIVNVALSPKSPLKALLSQVDTARTVDCTIVSVVPEQSSNRALITYTPEIASKYAKAGETTETIRTDRVDDPAALQLAHDLFPHAGTGTKIRLSVINKDKSEKQEKGFRTLIGFTVIGQAAQS
ncbi:hypothetical protein Bequi_09780 [Brachybacterium sp. JHP9]|uniref:Uncharacterized protein n=1 Tax=Brachybacterium equifaecis TaxID=2910770 RepID=A0ABT0R190_9MICO|nr:hypothetical protein [Brachybacterium equifaecis]MCL6423672.1 hypothetical protein [Brachybacterium equifaecis]